VIKQSVRKTALTIIHLIRPSYEREQLHYLLESSNPEGSLAERIYWLEQIMYWVRTSSPNRHGFDSSTGQLHNVRIRFLLHLLDRNPIWKTKVAATLRLLIQETTARSLFSQIGLSQQRGFLAEAFDRVQKRWLPRPAQERELSELFLRIFEDENDAIWVDHIPSSLMGQIVELICFNADKSELTFKNWRADLEDAILILGARVSSMGTLPEVSVLMRPHRIEESPFVRLNIFLLEMVKASRQPQWDISLCEKSLVEVEDGREVIRQVYEALEKSGVSVSLVYILENLSLALDRIELLVHLLLPPSDNTPKLVAKFLSRLVSARLSQSTLWSLVSTNLHLISSKIVERAGATGEHYITRTKKEYWEMIRLGFGGGAMMVGTTLIKYFLTSLKMALFFEGLFLSLNYSFGFVVLQLCGFTLATKQPSATASTLAGKLRELEEEGEVREFVNIVCRMTRSQFAALLGNLMAVIPIALCLDVTYFLVTKDHIFPVSTSRHVLESLDPIHSGTIFMAAFTGVWLWASSIVAGWFENWVVFRQIPEALATQRRLVQVFGEQGARKIGMWLQNNASLLGGNISLGFFLGFTLTIGRFLGLPFDVRHVTLSATALTFSICTLFGKVEWTSFLLPCLGVALIGLLNFAVGYSLSFAVAIRAREVKPAILRRLFRAVQVRFRNRPREFFFPKGR
jgi:site-specific recombinase